MGCGTSVHVEKSEAPLENSERQEAISVEPDDDDGVNKELYFTSAQPKIDISTSGDTESLASVGSLESCNSTALRQSKSYTLVSWGKQPPASPPPPPILPHHGEIEAPNLKNSHLQV
eukprot:m.286183 g.286183  ORF g.286183 m.286183 type:complete len:117 (+) comp183465_c0_seq1:188-538(+)